MLADLGLAFSAMTLLQQTNKQRQETVSVVASYVRERDTICHKRVA